MPISVSDQRVNEVSKTIIDTWSAPSYVFGAVRQEEANGREAFSVSSFASFTQGTIASVSGQNATAVDLQITINESPSFAINYDPIKADQNLGGNYVQELGRSAAGQMLGAIESDILEYLAFESPATGSAYTFNTSAVTLTSALVRSAISKLRSRKGIGPYSECLMAVDSYALGTMKTLVGFNSFVPPQAEGNLGLPVVASWDSIPLVESQYVPGASNNRRSMTPTAVSTTGSGASGVTTFTFASAHGLLAGMPISSSGLAINASGTNTVASVGSATSFVVNACSGNAAQQADPSGVRVLPHFATNIIMSKPHVVFAPSIVAQVKVVGQTTSVGDILQVYSLYGRGAWEGFVVRLLSPYEA